MAETSTDVVRREATAVQPWRETGSVQEIVANADKIAECMKLVMENNVHYGVIPGTGAKAKPTLLKPGAEKLGLLFRLRPEFQHTEVRDRDHLTVLSLCSLYHIPTGDCLARDVAGSCSTKESKYAYRQGNRRCPSCGSETIRKSKAEWGGGWYCSGKDGGCGAKFTATDPAIMDQAVGRIANPDLADQWNTVVKMADKRALVAATLIATAASDAFTQDLEDMHDSGWTEPADTPQQAARTTTQTRPAPKPATVVNGSGDFDPSATEAPASRDPIPDADPTRPLLAAVNALAGSLDYSPAKVANVATVLFKRNVGAKDLPGLSDADAERLAGELQARWDAAQAKEVP